MTLQVETDPALLPSLSRSWSTSALPLEGDPGPSLALTGLTEQHSGTYTCTVDTEIDSVTLEHRLVVMRRTRYVAEMEKCTGCKQLLRKFGPCLGKICAKFYTVLSQK